MLVPSSRGPNPDEERFSIGITGPGLQFYPEQGRVSSTSMLTGLGLSELPRNLTIITTRAITTGQSLSSTRLTISVLYAAVPRTRPVTLSWALLFVVIVIIIQDNSFESRPDP